MRDLKKEFTIPNGVNSLNATASLDPFYGPFESVEEAYNLVPENKRKVGKLFAIYLDSTESNIKLYYWITNSAGAEWRPIPLIPDIDTDRVVSLGAITVNGSVVTIGLPSGGSNIVQINNAIYSRYEPISFTTGPIIVAGNFRKDIIEARADSTVFYLKKGVESINPVPPAVTEGALFISEVLVTSTGVSAGALNSVVTDSTMKGDGTSGNPLGLSVAWVNQHYLQADNAVYAGFITGDKGKPYIRHIDMTVVELVTQTSVTTQLATKQDKSLFSALVDKMVHYYDSATAKMLSTGVEFVSAGILKLKSIILTTNSGTALPNELGTDGTNVVFGVSKRKLRYNDSSVYTYTPTGNFTLSEVQTAMENAGYVFNDSHIIINLGSNNFTCSIDNGASNPNTIITIGRSGTGSIIFTSTRTMNSGVDAVTILSGNESSMALIQTKATIDYLNIRNK